MSAWRGAGRMMPAALSRGDDEVRPPDDDLRLIQALELPPGPRSAATAREFCARAGAEWGLPPAVKNNLVDVASELVSNACRHTRTHVRLAVELGTTTLTARVWDDGPELPRVLPYRTGVSESGLGMHLVRRLSLRWGCITEDHGKWVWAVLPRSSGPMALYRRAMRAIGRREPMAG